MSRTAVYQSGAGNIGPAEIRHKDQRKALLITLLAFAIAAVAAVIAYLIPLG